MPCLYIFVGAFFPRVALVVMWLLGYSQPAFETILFPVLGFFFLPFTTCFYAIAMLEFGGIQGLGLVLLIVGVILDIGGWGGGAHYQRRRTVVVRR